MFKKVAIAAALVVTASVAQAHGGYVEVAGEAVKDRVTDKGSFAQYLRGGVDLNKDYKLGFQARNQRLDGDSGVAFNSIEATVSRGFGPAFVGVGLGHDNGARQYNYPIAVAGVFQKWGKVSAVAGYKYRAGFDDRNPAQGLAFTSVGYDVARGITVMANASRSNNDIKEVAYGAGVRFSF